MNTSDTAATIESRMVTHLLAFKLTVVAQELVSRLVQADQSAALATILEVLELESEARHERRVTRLRRASRLPTAKTFETFDEKRLSGAVVHKLEELKLGGFVDNAVNILAFGPPSVRVVAA